MVLLRCVMPSAYTQAYTCHSILYNGKQQHVSSQTQNGNPFLFIRNLQLILKLVVMSAALRTYICHERLLCGREQVDEDDTTFHQVHFGVDRLSQT